MKLTDLPAYCSSCFNQEPGARHVDMEAAWDGPAVQERDTPRGIDAIVIDDLILCEGCVREAGRLLGLVDPEEVHRALQVANGELLELRKAHANVLAYSSRLEEALAARPAPPEQPKPQGRAPRPKAVA